MKNWQETGGALGWSAELYFFLTEGVREWSKPVSESPKCEHTKYQNINDVLPLLALAKSRQLLSVERRKAYTVRSFLPLQV